jgi:hypothetical protein
MSMKRTWAISRDGVLGPCESVTAYSLTASAKCGVRS